MRTQPCKRCYDNSLGYWIKYRKIPPNKNIFASKFDKIDNSMKLRLIKQWRVIQRSKPYVNSNIKCRDSQSSSRQNLPNLPSKPVQMNPLRDPWPNLTDLIQITNPVITIWVNILTIFKSNKNLVEIVKLTTALSISGSIIYLKGRNHDLNLNELIQIYTQNLNLNERKFKFDNLQFYAMRVNSNVHVLKWFFSVQFLQFLLLNFIQI